MIIIPIRNYERGYVYYDSLGRESGYGQTPWARLKEQALDDLDNMPELYKYMTETNRMVSRLRTTAKAERKREIEILVSMLDLNKAPAENFLNDGNNLVNFITDFVKIKNTWIQLYEQLDKINTISIEEIMERIDFEVTTRIGKELDLSNFATPSVTKQQRYLENLTNKVMQDSIKAVANDLNKNKDTKREIDRTYLMAVELLNRVRANWASQTGTKLFSSYDFDGYLDIKLPSTEDMQNSKIKSTATGKNPFESNIIGQAVAAKVSQGLANALSGSGMTISMSTIPMPRLGFKTPRVNVKGTINLGKATNSLGDDVKKDIKRFVRFLKGRNFERLVIYRNIGEPDISVTNNSLGGLLPTLGADKIDLLENIVMNSMNGAILHERDYLSRIAEAIATQIAQLLFDKFEIVETGYGDSIYLFQVSGRLIPLSALLYALAEGFRSTADASRTINGYRNNFIDVTIDTGTIMYPYTGGPRGPGSDLRWNSQAEAGRNSITISVTLLSNFISSIVAGNFG